MFDPGALTRATSSLVGMRIRGVLRLCASSRDCNAS
jgi:hypothetical protein